MNEAEYEQLVQAAYDDRILVGIDRAFARRLYTNVATSEIEEATGEAPYLGKLVVWFAFLSSPIAMLGSSVLAAYAFRWWSLLIIPVTLLWWVFNRSRSVRGGASIWLHTLLVIVAVSAHFMDLFSNVSISGFVTAFVFALWCDRFLYWSSTFFLRAFVLRNQRAFEEFRDDIIIRTVEE